MFITITDGLALLGGLSLLGFVVACGLMAWDEYYSKINDSNDIYQEGDK